MCDLIVSVPDHCLSFYFSFEFYKVFWNDLGHFMLRALNYCTNHGELSDFPKQGVITCILKENKDQNY